MKKRKVLLLVFVLLLFVKVYAPNLSNEVVEKQFWIHYRTLSKLRIEENNSKELSRFLDAIGHNESRNNPKAYNKYGYIGKYQFGYAARKSCGYSEVKFGDFIKNPSIWSETDQDAAMIILLSKNELYLQDIIHKYNGKLIKGTIITKSGILAAAHLAGARGVQRYFINGSNPKDAYGTSLEDYLIKFSGFNFYIL